MVYSFFVPTWEKYRAGTRRVKPFAIGRDEVILALATPAILLLIYFPYLRGGSPSADRRFFEGKGSIVHINHSESKITLRHGVVDCLMPAMTMEYDLAVPALAQGRKPGEEVHFLVSPRGIDFAVVRIWPQEPKRNGRR